MIALVAAYDKNRVIGYKGRIPWNIQGEQRRFRELTTGNVVVMGRRTYEEIGRPLPNRTTIVVSSTACYEGENLRTVTSLAKALELALDKDVYISGGARLYEEALPIADKLYITEIEGSFEGDTFFLEFDESKYKRIIEKYNEGEIPYVYLTYEKI
ncbi:MAG: dihydrofolate reductase [Lachnospiraceae bacterium]|nr:dihydrofolate reductase [Lachnospiraceae bacterium]